MSFLKSYTSEKTSAVLKIKSAQSGGDPIEFPAFLTSFTNSFASSWNEEQVYGRIDPIGTFQSTKRTINVGFDIIAYNEADARENIKKINSVTSMLYPSYSSVGNALVLSKSPLVEIQFANLIHEDGGMLLGWIGSWSANPVLDMGMFTPNREELLPKVFNATFDFTPQHRKDLGFNRGGSSKATFPYKGGS